MGCVSSKPAVQGSNNSAVAEISEEPVEKKSPSREKEGRGKNAQSEMHFSEEEPELPLHKILPFAELTAEEVEALVVVGKSSIENSEEESVEDDTKPTKKAVARSQVTPVEDCMFTYAFLVSMEGNGEGQNPMPERLRKRMLAQKRKSKSLWIKAQQQQVASANREEHLRQRREKARRSQLGRKVLERQGVLADGASEDGIQGTLAPPSTPTGRPKLN